MTFKEYYGETFRADINAVISSRPSPHSEGREVVIQPRTLSTENPIIRAWDQERINLFSTALFFTVLVDQVCYTHFGSNYSQFRALTLYPKYCGDCPGACSYHLHPMHIFKAIGSSPGPGYNWSGKAKLLEEAIEVMHVEVLDFFNVHHRSVDGKQFWRRCADEIIPSNK